MRASKILIDNSVRLNATFLWQQRQIRQTMDAAQTASTLTLDEIELQQTRGGLGAQQFQAADHLGKGQTFLALHFLAYPDRQYLPHSDACAAPQQIRSHRVYWLANLSKFGMDMHMPNFERFASQ